MLKLKKKETSSLFLLLSLNLTVYLQIFLLQILHFEILTYLLKYTSKESFEGGKIDRTINIYGWTTNTKIKKHTMIVK